MTWNVVIRPEVENDIADAAKWYECRREGLGKDFREEIIAVLEALAKNPLLNCRRHPSKNIRWRYPQRFPYRVIYEVLEAEGVVVVAAVLHGARHEKHWRKRM